MAEYTEKEALIAHIKDLPTWWADAGGVYGRSMKYPEGMFDCEDVISSVENAPAADVAPVVRCKDCRYWQDNNGGYPNKECRWREDETPDADDFCSCGERKEVIDDGNQQENACGRVSEV